MNKLPFGAPAGWRRYGAEPGDAAGAAGRAARGDAPGTGGASPESFRGGGGAMLALAGRRARAGLGLLQVRPGHPGLVGLGSEEAGGQCGERWGELGGGESPGGAGKRGAGEPGVGAGRAGPGGEGCGDGVRERPESGPGGRPGLGQVAGAEGQEGAPHAVPSLIARDALLRSRSVWRECRKLQWG